MSMIDGQTFDASGNPVDDGETDGSSVQSLLDILNAGTQDYSTIAVTNANAQRIAAGYPALTAAQVQAITGNMPNASYSAATSTINWPIVIIIGIAAWFLLSEDN